MSRWFLFVFSLLGLLGCTQMVEEKSQPEGISIAPLEDVDESTVSEQKFEHQSYGIYERRAYEGQFYNELVAYYLGKETVILDTLDELCIWPDTVQDFDGNGHEDLLVRHAGGCGGNCCGDSFFFISNHGDGTFNKTAEYGWAWSDAIVERWHGRWTVVFTSNNDGLNNDDYEESTDRYVLEHDSMVLVETKVRPEIEAFAEVRAKQFDFDKQDEIIELKFDLDEDGEEDEIRCRFWDRWGRILATITMSNGDEIMDDGFGSKRVGVLATMTNGMHDLVGDLDDVFKWDGKAYGLNK